MWVDSVLLGLGTREWWLEATTFGLVTATRKLEVKVVCGAETVTCVDCDDTRTVVYSRNDTYATPYYEIQSLRDPYIPMIEGRP